MGKKKLPPPRFYRIKAKSVKSKCKECDGSGIGWYDSYVGEYTRCPNPSCHGGTHWGTEFKKEYFEPKPGKEYKVGAL